MIFFGTSMSLFFGAGSKKTQHLGAPIFNCTSVVFLLLATGCQAERNVRHNPQRLFINVVTLGFLGKQR